MKLLIVIAFHFNPEKIELLKKVVSLHPAITDQVECIVTTNSVKSSELDEIMHLTPKAENYKLEVVSFPNLPHPWLLPWGHKQIVKEKFSDPSYTHFLYIEDDMGFNRMNFDYWLESRELIKDTGLYPSFNRVEFNGVRNLWVLVDQVEPISALETGVISRSNENKFFMNLKNPYQGLFLYDRELMLEHINSYTFDINKYGRVDLIDHNPEWPGGGVAERANFALTFDSIPSGFTSRSAVCVIENLGILDPRSFVHHLPNKYTNLDNSCFGRVPALQPVIRC